MPAQNIEAEMSVLGSLMLDHNAIIKVADILRNGSFYKNGHQLIFGVMLELFEKKEPIDVLSVSAKLKEKNLLEETGGIGYLTELINSVPSASNVHYYAEIVRKKEILRNLLEASSYLSELSYKEDENVEDIIDEAEKKIFGISQEAVKQKFINVKDALEEAWERIDQLHKSPDKLRGVPTGFKKLDNILAGLQKSDLVILAARPSLGKTALAMDIARNAAIKYNMPVGIFSLEMPVQQIIDRFLSAESGIDLWKIRTGKLQSDLGHFDHISHALERLSRAPIFIDDEPSNSVLQIRTMARRLQLEHNIGLLVIDYLQLIKPRNPSDSPVQQVTETSRSLKALARELKIPVLALSQLSRAVEMRPRAIPRLSDLRDSGCLAGNTVIMKADTGELVSIKDLEGKRNIPVFSLNNNLKLEIKKISKVFSSGVKEIFALKTKSGKIIKASGNHPFLTIAGWQKLESLSKHMRIALPRFITPLNKKSLLSNSEIIMLAHLLGDGCVLRRQPIHYTSADIKNISIVSKEAKRLFNITPRLIRQKNWFHLYLPSPYRVARGKHNPIIKWFLKLGIKPARSYEKILPKILFMCPENQISLFLHHLWATDGNISFKNLPKRKTSGAIYYSTTSKALAQDIQHLLLRLKIMSTLRVAFKKNYRPNYQVHIQGSQMQTHFCRIIGCYGERGKIIKSLIKKLEIIRPNPNLDVIPREIWNTVSLLKNYYKLSWRDFARNLNIAYNGSAIFKNGVSRERLQRIIKFMPDDALINLSQSDIYWDEIVSITPLGKEKVFDATIPGTHNFIANDFIVHNSIEQDADVVMFIYREDRYKESSTRENQADIIIAKHRNGQLGKATLYFHPEKTTFSDFEKEEIEGGSENFFVEGFD